jgi:hypothetical protein
MHLVYNNGRMYGEQTTLVTFWGANEALESRARTIWALGASMRKVQQSSAPTRATTRIEGNHAGKEVFGVEVPFGRDRR